MPTSKLPLTAGLHIVQSGGSPARLAARAGAALPAGSGQQQAAPSHRPLLANGPPLGTALRARQPRLPGRPRPPDAPATPSAAARAQALDRPGTRAPHARAAASPPFLPPPQAGVPRVHLDTTQRGTSGGHQPALPADCSLPVAGGVEAAGGKQQLLRTSGGKARLPAVPSTRLQLGRQAAQSRVLLAHPAAALPTAPAQPPCGALPPAAPRAPRCGLVTPPCGLQPAPAPPPAPPPTPPAAAWRTRVVPQSAPAPARWS